MIVLVILYNRPEYTHECLAYLSECRGIEKCRVFFQIEPFNQQVVRQAFEWTASPCSIVINDERLGCNANLYAGLSRAFSADETVAVIEDDVFVSRDWLEFASRPEYRADPSVLAVCAFRKITEPPAVLDWHGHSRVSQFNPWAWLSWRDRWEKLKHAWSANTGNHVAWDTAINQRGFVPPGSIVQPNISRSFNCGAEGGAYCTGYDAWLANNFTPFWSENLS